MSEQVGSVTRKKCFLGIVTPPPIISNGPTFRDRSFITFQDGGGHSFLRGLILGGQFWKCTKCEGGRHIKKQGWPSMKKLSNYIMIETYPSFFQK